MTQPEDERNNRNPGLEQRALTMLALAMQEAERDRIRGRVGVELEYRDGIIQVMRRQLVATEK